MTQEEAIKTVDRIFNYCEEIDCHLPEDEQTGYNMYSDINAVKEYIRNTTEVVRCEDCKYGIENGELCGRKVYLCSALTNPNEFYGDFFCAGGERKETDE